MIDCRLAALACGVGLSMSAAAGGAVRAPASAPASAPATQSGEAPLWASLRQLQRAPLTPGDDRAAFVRQYVSKFERIIEIVGRLVGQFPNSRWGHDARLMAARAHLSLRSAAGAREQAGLAPDTRNHTAAARRLVDTVLGGGADAATRARAELEKVFVVTAEAVDAGMEAAKATREVEIKGLEAYVKRFPSSVDTANMHLRIGQLYESLGDYGGALGAYDELTRLHPKSKAAGEAWFRLGLARRTAGENDKAGQAFARAVELDPKSMTGRMAAGYIRRGKLVGRTLDVAWPGLDGKPVAAARFRGRVLLIDIWSTRCEPCVGSLPHLVDLYEQYKDKGLAVVGVSLDPVRADLVKVVESRKLPWTQTHLPEGFGGDFAIDYAIDQLPQYWLVDRKGRVRTLDARQELEQWVARLLAE